MTEIISRDTAISRLRSKLVELTDAERSLCLVAAELGIFCGGFSRYTDEELRKAYPIVVERHPTLSRPELERAANDWQLKRQVDVGVFLSCDAQQLFHETCRGWEDFSNEQLAQFCARLLCEEAVVSG